MLYFLPLAYLATIPSILASPYCGLVPPKQALVNSQASDANGSTEDVVLSAWYPGWLGNEYPPSQVPWSKYSEISFAFATTTPDVNTLALDSVSQQTLPTFVSTAKSHGVKAIVALGGWTGSQYFSSAVATEQNRTAFVQTILNFVKQYKIDGIDFDWEYPNHQGIGCNTISPQDSANFLLLIQALRKTSIGSNLIISAAVGLSPFAGADGQPMTSVSAFAEVLDHVEIMAYDIWGSWSTAVGPNAPLNDSCAPTPEGSVQSAFNAWTAAGFPADKLVLGVASYGHSFFVNSTNALSSSGELAPYPPFVAALQPTGDKWDGSGSGVDQCGNPVTVGGIFDFWGLADAGFLGSNGTTAAGIYYRYDNCSQTPYTYNKTSQVMVSYDDATSFAVKGHFINNNKLKGFAMWHVGGDSNDILIDSISSAMGIEQVCS